jgi:hypothetical protein
MSPDAEDAESSGREEVQAELLLHGLLGRGL